MTIETIRAALAEVLAHIDAQAKQISAYKTIEAALTARCTALCYAVDRDKSATAMLQSERDANAILTGQVERQAVEITALTSALAKCRDSMPVPSPGSAREVAWGQAIGSPADVPQYVKEASNELLAEIARLEAKRENTVTVSANKLREVLEALLGPPHHIRELQALTGSTVESLTGDTAITALVKEFNAAMKEQP